MVLVSQLVMVLVCAALAALIVLRYLVVSIRKKASRRRIVITGLLIPISFLLVLIAGSFSVANSDAVKTESNHYALGAIRSGFEVQCGRKALDEYLKTVENDTKEVQFDARGYVIGWRHGAASCDLVQRQWQCTCPDVTSSP